MKPVRSSGLAMLAGLIAWLSGAGPEPLLAQATLPSGFARFEAADFAGIRPGQSVAAGLAQLRRQGFERVNMIPGDPYLGCGFEKVEGYEIHPCAFKTLYFYRKDSSGTDYVVMLDATPVTVSDVSPAEAASLIWRVVGTVTVDEPTVAKLDYYQKLATQKYGQLDPNGPYCQADQFVAEPISHNIVAGYNTPSDCSYGLFVMFSPADSMWHMSVALVDQRIKERETGATRDALVRAAHHRVASPQF